VSYITYKLVQTLGQLDLTPLTRGGATTFRARLRTDFFYLSIERKADVFFSIMQFIPIEVLLGISHTYRHDLKSFFYVLLWICARHGWPDGPPKNSALTKWYSGTFDDIANAKFGHITKGENKGFGFIMREFPQTLM
jgi:Fungal protein kinase